MFSFDVTKNFFQREEKNRVKTILKTNITFPKGKSKCFYSVVFDQDSINVRETSELLPCSTFASDAKKA